MNIVIAFLYIVFSGWTGEHSFSNHGLGVAASNLTLTSVPSPLTSPQIINFFPLRKIAQGKEVVVDLSFGDYFTGIEEGNLTEIPQWLEIYDQLKGGDVALLGVSPLLFEEESMTLLGYGKNNTLGLGLTLQKQKEESTSTTRGPFSPYYDKGTATLETLLTLFESFLFFPVSFYFLSMVLNIIFNY